MFFYYLTNSFIYKSCDRQDGSFNTVDSEAQFLKSTTINGEDKASKNCDRLSSNGWLKSSRQSRASSDVSRKFRRLNTTHKSEAENGHGRAKEQWAKWFVDEYSTRRSTKLLVDDSQIPSLTFRTNAELRSHLDNRLVEKLIRHLIGLIALVVVLLAVLSVGGGFLIWKVVRLSEELKTEIGHQIIPLSNNLTESPLDPTSRCIYKTSVSFFIF